ncbi:type IV pilus modification protein PilV [Pseudomonas deceptionensis]|uniref:Type IV pilus assembly protein PilV n=1 Tax=Pseudomonas deceptionensis TaxID=882211 RepID=A0A0J6GJL5_PSEDM|nr:type IV pilus modification protein PilV [Pseudomonas deceptionensis]KMM81865.1 pilus assembly protein PilV [Pseudomonas deceptionensis]SEE63888.1 type IV pilus assembly protein PilV [Pseudomonas deceptionensis]
MAHLYRNRQAGMTLIEVLIALLILVISLLGAAGMQLNALKYTASALMSTQASFVAYAMLDRMRANSGGDYRVSAVEQVSPTVTGVVGHDLSEFKRNIRDFGGETARGEIAVIGQQVNITLQWDDARAGKHEGDSGAFTLSSRIAGNAGVSAS